MPFTYLQTNGQFNKQSSHFNMISLENDDICIGLNACNLGCSKTNSEEKTQLVKTCLLTVQLTYRKKSIY